MNYTIGSELLQNMYHVEVVRSHLTRNLSNLYPEIRDEIFLAFDEVLDLRDNGEWCDSLSCCLFLFAEIERISEWKSVHALSAIQNVVCRTSNRLFVGLPLCMHIFFLNIFPASICSI